MRAAVLHHATEGILDAAAEFLWSDEMAESLEAFSTNHAELFQGVEGMDVEDGEHRLEWTQAHLDFQQLFEFQLEQFVGSQDFTQEQFVAACQDALDANSSSSYTHDSAGYTASIVEMVLMTTTYNFFVRMMIAAANSQKLQSNPERTKETGGAGELEPEPSLVAQETGGQLLAEDFDRLSREDEEASGGVE